MSINRTLDNDLKALYDADRREHQLGLVVGTPEYDAMRMRDRERRRLADNILTSGTALGMDDLYHAAWLFNHGETVADAKRSFELARSAAEQGHPSAKWLSAAAYDRWLMYMGQVQKFGTQIVPDGERFRVWDVDPRTTDAERAQHDVPPIAELERRAEELTRTQSQPPMELAPAWLRRAVERWREPDADASQSDSAAATQGS